MLGLPCFAQAAMDDLAPAYYTGSHLIRMLKSSNLTAHLLVGACQRLWLVTFDDAYGSSPGLGMSSSLALRPL